MRRALGNLALALGSLAVLLGAGEALLRAIPDPSDAARFSAFRPDGVLGYALRPDVATVQESDEYRVPVHTNALGLRGRPATQEKPPGVRRILVLGDSFAFGFGVGDEETFSALLEARLDGRLGPVEVLNAGVPGWSADHYLVFLRTRGFDLAPDLVLVAQTENDPGDLGWNRLTLDERRLPVRVESTRRVIDHRGRMRYVRGAPLLEFPGVEWLSDHSFLFHWIRFRLAKLAVVQSQEAERRRREKAAEAPPAGPIEALPPEQVQRGLGTGRAFQLRYHRHLLAAIERECAEQAVALRVLLIAFRPGTQEEGDDAEALRADCAALGSRCLDTRGLFTPDETEAAFFAKDGHWTPFGHRRVAEALADRLTADPALAR